MRCHMCDEELIEVEMDDDNKVLPCPACTDAIIDSLLDFGDTDVNSKE